MPVTGMLSIRHAHNVYSVQVDTLLSRVQLCAIFTDFMASILACGAQCAACTLEYPF
jgi:hypothetical protein